MRIGGADALRPSLSAPLLGIFALDAGETTVDL